MPNYLDELKELMAARRGDASYACARFIGICHSTTPASALSLGVFNTDEGRVYRGEWSAISHGDAGVVVVDCGDFSWRAYAGYLAEAKPDELKKNPDDCPTGIKDQIRTVLDYLWDDERKNYEAEPSEGHVFESLAAVDAWLTHYEPDE